MHMYPGSKAGLRKAGKTLVTPPWSSLDAEGARGRPLVAAALPVLRQVRTWHLQEVPSSWFPNLDQQEVAKVAGGGLTRHTGSAGRRPPRRGRRKPDAPQGYDDL